MNGSLCSLEIKVRVPGIADDSPKHMRADLDIANVLFTLIQEIVLQTVFPSLRI